MTVHHEQHPVESDLNVNFHNVTQQVADAVARAKVRNGIVVVYSQHTTCSVILQEESHDATYHGTKFLLQDLVNLFEKIVPRCRHEGQYLHPGREHIDHAVNNLSEEAAWSLNTDAHLRSCLLGRSESIPIIGGKADLGEFGQVYFVDFDTVRARRRVVHIQVVGE
jgi:secondary thiamine-phosphate synthase enzyme